jgi:hypothetical protein
MSRGAPRPRFGPFPAPDPSPPSGEGAEGSGGGAGGGRQGHRQDVTLAGRPRASAPPRVLWREGKSPSPNEGMARTAGYLHRVFFSGLPPGPCGVLSGEGGGRGRSGGRGKGVARGETPPPLRGGELPEGPLLSSLRTFLAPAQSPPERGPGGNIIFPDGWCRTTSVLTATRSSSG